MLKLSKMTDYAALILARMQAEKATLGAGENPVSVASLSAKTELSEPTVSKILKLLTQGGMVRSVRGPQGGYILDASLDDISVADLIKAIDGPIAVTACVDHDDKGCCALEGNCTIRGGWDALNQEMIGVLGAFSVNRLLQTSMKQTKEAI